MEIIGTVKCNKSGETYFVNWDENESIVYISLSINGPWTEIEKDLNSEGVALIVARNYVNRIKSLQYLL